MKTKFLRKLFLFSSLILSLFCSGLSAEAASFSMSASVQQVAPGGSFTVSVGGDCIGRVNLSVSGGTIASSAVWTEENYQTVSVTAGNSGTVTITATPEAGFSDSNGDEYKPGSRSVSVKIVAPSQPAPAQPSNPTPSGNTTTQTPTKPQTNPTPSTPTSANTEKPTGSEEPEESETSEPEDEESTEEPQPEDDSEEGTDENAEDEPNPCQTLEDNNKLAWTLAGIFALLFCGVTITLLCVVFTYKAPHHTEPEPQPEPEPKPAQKSKTKSTGRKTKRTTKHEETH